MIIIVVNSISVNDALIVDNNCYQLVMDEIMSFKDAQKLCLEMEGVLFELERNEVFPEEVKF